MHSFWTAATTPLLPFSACALYFRCHQLPDANYLDRRGSYIHYRSILLYLRVLDSWFTLPLPVYLPRFTYYPAATTCHRAAPRIASRFCHRTAIPLYHLPAALLCWFGHYTYVVTDYYYLCWCFTHKTPLHACPLLRTHFMPFVTTACNFCRAYVPHRWDSHHYILFPLVTVYSSPLRAFALFTGFFCRL